MVSPLSATTVLAAARLATEAVQSGTQAVQSFASVLADSAPDTEAPAAAVATIDGKLKDQLTELLSDFGIDLTQPPAVHFQVDSSGSIEVIRGETPLRDVELRLNSTTELRQSFASFLRTQPGQSWSTSVT